MASTPDDDFYFNAPPEEDDVEDLYFNAPEDEEIGDEENATTNANLGSGDFSASSQPFAAESLQKTVERLVYKKCRKLEQPNKVSMETEVTTHPQYVSLRNSKPQYVSAILKKLHKIDIFEDIDTSLPYWRTLTYLCSNDNDSNSLAFVQDGGIIQAARAFQDFLVRITEGHNDGDFEAVTEILRCLTVVTASPMVINVDMSWIVDIVGCFIDLRSWTLTKLNTLDKVQDLNQPIECVFKIVPGDKKDVKKASTLFPYCRAGDESTNFGVWCVKDLSHDQSPPILESNEVWKMKPKMALKGDYSVHLNVVNVVFTHQFNATTFIGYFKTGDDGPGDDRWQKLQAIEGISQCYLKAGVLSQYNRRPILGTVCMCYFDQTYRRAIVTGLNVADSSMLVVFLLDYGVSMEVSVTDLYQMPDKLMKEKPLTFIFMIKDFIPKPNVPVFEASLNVLLNLSANRATERQLNTDIVESLMEIISLMDQNRFVQIALKILTNLAVPTLSKRKILLDCESVGRLYILGAELTDVVLNKSETAKDTSGDSDNYAVVHLQLVLECLANIAKHNQDTRRDIMKIKGVILPNRIMSTFGKETPVYQAAMNLMTALFTSSPAASNGLEKLKTWEDKAATKSNEPSALNKLIQDALKVKSGKVAHSAYFTPDMLKMCSQPENAAIALKPPADVQAVLERVAVPLTGDRYYVRGEKLDLAAKNHWTVNCFQTTDLHKLKTRYVQELCCAALNTREKLTIYFGLLKDECVQGLYINQSERDEFRVGIDWSLSRAFRPFLEPTMYNVEFVPVCVGTHQSKPVPNHYVVEIQIRHISTEAYQVEKDGAAYFRINGQVVQLSLQEAGEWFAHEIDKERKANLDRLRYQIEIMKKILDE